MLPLETQIHDVIAKQKDYFVTTKLIRKLTEDIMEQIEVKDDQ